MSTKSCTEEYVFQQFYVNMFYVTNRCGNWFDVLGGPFVVDW